MRLQRQVDAEQKKGVTALAKEKARHQSELKEVEKQSQSVIKHKDSVIEVSVSSAALFSILFN